MIRRESTSYQSEQSSEEETKLIGTEHYTLERMIEKTGGFGRIQFMILLCMFVSNIPTAFYAIGLPTLEQFPQYTWKTSSGVSYYCSRSQICFQGKPKEDIEWEIDWNNSQSIMNWVQELDLLCVPKFEIGLFGSLYFFGFALSGIFLKISDHIGRRKVIQIGCLFCCFIITYLYAFPDIYIRYIMLFLLGVIAFRLVALYILIMELCPSEYHKYVSAGYALMGNYIGVIIPYIYFKFFGRDYKNVYILAVIVTPLSFILSMFLPESPLYFYENRKMEELKKEFKVIAEFNKTTIPEEYEFVFEDGTIVDDDNKDNRHIWSMLKDRKIWINLFLAIFTFSAISFWSNLVNFHSKYFNANGYDMTFLMVHADIIGTGVALGMKRYFSTAKLIMLSFGLTTIWTVPLNFIPEVDILTTVSVVCCQFGVSMCYYLSILNISETFPPLFIAFAFSIWNLCGSMSNVFSPMIAEITHPIPMRMLFSISLLIWLLTFLNLMHSIWIENKHHR
jgi:MFS family permease